MIVFNILVPLIFFFLLYLAIQIFKITIFFIYLVQVKEYRRDRIKAHFRTKSGKNQLRDYFNLLKWRKFYRPKFTYRAFMISILTFIIQYNFFFFSLRFFVHLFKGFPSALIFLLILVVFLVNLITPLAVFLSAALSVLVFWPIKKAIIFLAQKKIKKAKNLLVIGITGSYGKTATKEILSFILSGFFNTLKTPANCNTEIGIASLVLRKLKPSHEILVVEMGAYKKGEIKAICQIVRPKIGIITGINEQHLELFGSLSNTQWAKFELIKSLPKNGLAIFNGNNSFTQRLFKATRINKKLYGQKRKRFKMPLEDGWHQENVEAALLVTDFLGWSRGRAKQRLKELKTFPLALKVIKKGKEAVIINDSYSANPTGFLAALDILKKTSKSRKILITPGIIELGKASDKVHKKIGQKASRICTKIFLTKPDFQEAIEKGISKRRKKGFIEVEEDEVELWEKLSPFLDKKTAVLLEGRLPNFLIKKLCQ
jgi:UDP-N-acetylmuramoyl-tripeptide--D-alanyl-D-alanine ligase